jgi:glyoxylase-like metal-dependent hydrolase (beta-lactamase superfamily II)
MRTLLHIITIIPIAAAALPTAAAGQQPAPFAIASAARARQVVEAGVAAIGGLDSLRRVGTIRRDLSGVRSDWGQGLDPGRHSDRPLTAVSAADLRGRRAYLWNRSRILGGQPFEFLGGATASAAYSANATLRTVTPAPPGAAPQALARLMRRHPEAVLLAALDRVNSLRYLGRDGGDERVSFADVDGEQVTLAFDAATHLLRRLERVYDDPVRGDAVSAIAFEDYRRAGPVLTAWRIVDLAAGQVLQTLTASRVAVDEPLSDSLFAPPAGYETAAQPATAPQELAPGITVYPGGYTSVVLEQSDHLIVLEPGGNQFDAERRIAALKTRFPGKPIRYVVATHFHHDHLGGVRAYVAEGATIVTTGHARQAVELAARAPHRIRPDALQRRPAEPRIEVVAGRRVLGEGAQRVELYDIGPNPHAAQMLIAWIPAARAVLEADLLDVTGGRVTPAGDDTRAFAAKLRELRLEPERIIAVHSGMATPADLAAALAAAP